MDDIDVDIDVGAVDDVVIEQLPKYDEAVG